MSKLYLNRRKNECLSVELDGRVVRFRIDDIRPQTVRIEIETVHDDVLIDFPEKERRTKTSSDSTKTNPLFAAC